MPIEQSRRPSPWLAALLSALIPGLGQIRAGDRRRGVRLVIIDLVLVALFVIALLFFQTSVLKAWASLPTLSLIMVGNLMLLSYRGWAAYDAFNVSGGSAGVAATAITVVVGVAVWMVVLVPHLAVGYYNVVQYSLISEVFAPADTGVEAAPDSPTETEGAPATETTLKPQAIWDGLERLNVLLLGTDVGAGREDVRTDTMILLSIDPESGDAAMISLPRNMSGVTLPDGYGVWDCNCFPRLLNDIYFEATENPEYFPGEGEPGPRAIKATIGNLLGLDIHYYAMVTLDGFVGIVDALGGVDIEVPNTIVDETYPHEDGVTVENVVIEAGEQHLDGHLALAYARIRRHADDFARMNRQRCVLGAVLAQSSPIELLASYGAIAEVLKATLETDIPQDRLVDFIDLLPVISFDRVGVLHVDREYISGTDTGRTFYDEDRIKAETALIIADPTSAYDGLSLENTCD
ncbi:MAG: LCP family protein [Acidimicrobiia bacterium]